MDPVPISRVERWNGLAVIPVLLTFTYPLWSPFPADALWPTLMPQLAAYAGLIFWCVVNDRCFSRLFITADRLAKNLLRGGFIGVLTGLVNLWVIVGLTPRLGYRFDFLRDTPHARMPFAVMVPWGIVLIAFWVELNFRGFILGRLAVMSGDKPYGPAIAVTVSALAFSWDPFMLTVFRGYHWLALTDGLIWGGLLIYTRNLFSTVAAHAVEVILVYSVLKIFYA
ncbi:MAG: hypothetical protein HY204_01005 [Nitrospirae bacterium]|nr:hypothetical protein [Nitrospirota bacterium]